MFGLSFLSPLFLAGLAAAAIPIALHLFQRRAEPVVDFGALRYLRRAPVEHASRRRLKELILLALRVSALLLLAVAFARPYLAQSAAALSGPATLVLVDTSVSMTAPGQFGRARALAEKAIRSAPATHAVGVITFANGGEVVAPVSADRAGALAAIARLQPGAGATRYRTALSRASEALGNREGRIIVITDLQEAGWDAADGGAVPERVEVSVEDAGAPEGNIAVTSLRIEGSDAVAIVHNHSLRPRNEHVEFAIDGRRLTVVPVVLPPDGSAEVRSSIEARTSGALSASVSDERGYVADNVRHAVLDSTSMPSVLAITATGQPSDAFYLQRALEVADDVSGFRFRALSGTAFSRLAADALADTDAIIVLATRGLEHRGRQLLGSYLRSGGGLLIATGADVDAAVLKEALAGGLETGWTDRPARALRFAPDDSRHPVFRPFGGVGMLSDVSFARAGLLAPGAGADVIARYSDGTPALVEEQSGAGRILVFASDLNNRWNDFPVQPAFVPFAHEALRYLASVRAPRADYLVGDLPGASGSRPGVVRTADGRRVAVNVDPRESDPARLTADGFRANVTRLTARASQQAREEAREREESQRLWQWGLMLMVVGLAAEAMVGRRLG